MPIIGPENKLRPCFNVTWIVWVDGDWFDEIV